MRAPLHVSHVIRIFVKEKFKQVLTIALVLGFGIEAVAGASDANLDKDRLALQGYDPVSYFRDGGPLAGSDSLTVERDGAIYRFATEANQRDFRESPENYEPAFGGWCAWAMLEGDKVEIDPLSFRIFEGKLLVFYNGFWGDTKEKWQKKAKRDTEAKLFETASTEWAELSKGK